MHCLGNIPFELAAPVEEFALEGRLLLFVVSFSFSNFLLCNAQASVNFWSKMVLRSILPAYLYTDPRDDFSHQATHVFSYIQLKS